MNPESTTRTSLPTQTRSVCCGAAVVAGRRGVACWSCRGHHDVALLGGLGDRGPARRSSLTTLELHPQGDLTVQDSQHGGMIRVPSDYVDDADRAGLRMHRAH